MRNVEIKEKLNDIFVKRFDLNILEKDFSNKELLGKDVGLDARDLIYVFFDVERVFEFKIDEKYIVENKFRTFNNIFGVICEKLGLKNA